MSKSLGNFVDLEQLNAYAGRYSLDALRWYLVTQGPLGNHDADFAHAKFVEVFNADLANGVGNSTSRVANMVEKYFGGKLPLDARAIRPEALPTKLKVARPAGEGDGATAATTVVAYDDLGALVRDVEKSVATRVRALDVAGALKAGTGLVGAVDLFINETAPFKLAKLADSDPAKKQQLAVILTTCAELLRVAALLLTPAMPKKMAQVLADWSSAPPAGVPLAELVRLDGPHSLKAGTAIKKGAILFQRADPAEAPPRAAAAAS